MRRAVSAVAATCLLLSATVLAFFSGGYYAEPRLIAGLVAWALVLALALAGPAPLPRSSQGRLAVAGLVALTAWSAVSLLWAPLAGPAVQNVQRLVLYVGVLLVAVAVLRALPWALRAVEPALAAGATIVIGYGLSGRLLPSVIELGSSRTANGRLEQPITYWNAEGLLAAVGLVLCARLAGDRTRPLALRAAAAAGCAPLGAGVYLSFSRGALAAAVLGLVVAVAAAPTRAQLRAVVIALVAAIAAVAATAPFPGVASLAGSSADRGRDGAIALAALLAIGAAAAFACVRLARRSDAARRLRSSQRLTPVAVAVTVAVLVGLIIGGLGERPSQAELAAGADAGRLASATSNRYEYWRVGLEAFASDPVQGLGSGGFRVAWLQERTIAEVVKDAHSLQIEALAELGLVGVLALAAFLAGVVLAGRRALARTGEAAAGACAALMTWLAHASIDWDWQLPAVTIPALVLAGALVALVERDAPDAGPADPSRAEPAAAVALTPAATVQDRSRA